MYIWIESILCPLVSDLSATELFISLSLSLIFMNPLHYYDFYKIECVYLYTIYYCSCYDLFNICWNFTFLFYFQNLFFYKPFCFQKMFWNFYIFFLFNTFVKLCQLFIFQTMFPIKLFQWFNLISWCIQYICSYIHLMIWFVRGFNGHREINGWTDSHQEFYNRYL